MIIRLTMNVDTDLTPGQLFDAAKDAIEHDEVAVSVVMSGNAAEVKEDWIHRAPVTPFEKQVFTSITEHKPYRLHFSERLAATNHMLRALDEYVNADVSLAATEGAKEQ